MTLPSLLIDSAVQANEKLLLHNDLLRFSPGRPIRLLHMCEAGAQNLTVIKSAVRSCCRSMMIDSSKGFLLVIKTNEFADSGMTHIF